MTSSHPQPAKRQRTTADPDTRDEKALPRSEAGIKQIRKSPTNHFIKLPGSLRLNDTNWDVWRAHMITQFQNCGVEGYVNGTIRCPDPAADLEGVDNWSCNDNFARVLISWNVTPREQVRILGCDSAHEMWNNLEDAHESQGSKRYKPIFAQWRKLFGITAKEGDNIVEHLDKLKQCRHRINFEALGGKQYEISDTFFISIIAVSLPPSYEDFMVTTIDGVDDSGMFSTFSPQRFINLIEREYRYREQCDRENRPT